MKTAITLAERGWLPDRALRSGIRRLVARRHRDMSAVEPALQHSRKAAFARHLADGPIAVQTDAANRQHYEVPAAFYERVLGPRLKYSSCYYPEAGTTLAAAEQAMLVLTGERAGLADGQQVLELGCGWGSLTLWMAEHYPASTITAVSNSASQRAFIEARARERGLANVRVVTADINDFDPGVGGERPHFDRVVSVEMFEHLRNWPLAFERVAGWLRPEGRAFLHVFCHREQPYLYEDRGEGDWMARHFFTGGMMPSADLPGFIADHLEVERQWQVDGRHYQRTADDWLANLDRQRGVLLPVLADTYGPAEARRWLHRWRLFFMGCSELFGYGDGQQWWVAHFRLKRRDDR